MAEAYAFMVAGVYVPYFYIQHYALDLGINDSMTFNIVSIMNAATFFGRFPYNYLADMYVTSSHLQSPLLTRPNVDMVASQCWSHAAWLQLSSSSSGALSTPSPVSSSLAQRTAS